MNLKGFGRNPLPYNKKTTIALIFLLIFGFFAFNFKMQTSEISDFPASFVNLPSSKVLEKIYTWLELDGKDDEAVAKDSESLDGFNRATWSFWAKQNNYTQNAGLIGKYAPGTGKRSYLIKTILNNGTGIILSKDGLTTESQSTTSDRGCGLRKNGEWTMITLTYNGSLITYYRNGKKCDSDSTKIDKIFSSTEKLRIGGGNGIFFNGSMDDIKIYNEALTDREVLRLYDESDYGGNLGKSAAVILYHQIDDNNDASDKVKTSDFELQMRYLHDIGIKSITTQDFNDWKKGEKDIPEKNVIIFFDDGWKSVYEKAMPIMDKYGLVGTIALVSDHADGAFGSKYMNWNEIKELQNKGWKIEAHGKSHVKMAELSEDEFIKQLIVSKENITNNLGTAPTSFIFPYNNATQKYVDMCAKYYDLCWTRGESAVFPRYNYKSTNATEYNALKRIGIVNDTYFDVFKGVFLRFDGIIAEWHMDEYGNLIAKDYSEGYNNDAELINGAHFAKNAGSQTQACFGVGRKVQTLENTPVYENPTTFSDRYSYALLRAGAIGTISDGMKINGVQWWNVALEKASVKEGELFVKTDLKEGGWINEIYLASIDRNGCYTSQAASFKAVENKRKEIVTEAGRAKTPLSKPAVSRAEAPKENSLPANVKEANLKAPEKQEVIKLGRAKSKANVIYLN